MQWMDREFSKDKITWQRLAEQAASASDDAEKAPLDLEANDFREALELLLEAGDVIRVNKELVYASANLEAFKVRLVEYLKTNETIDTAGLKALTGASRKWTIPLGEYFDTIRLTVRVGEGRRLR